MARNVSWEHAVVLGGGYAGLLAARVIADHFRQVTIVERDLLGDEPHRPGTPQAHHPHGLLARGAEILEALFPGLRSQLLGAGCPVTDFGTGTRTLFPSGWAPSEALGIDVQLLARTTLEGLLRRRVTALSAVTLRDRTQADGLIVGRDGQTAEVVVRRRGPQSPGKEPERILADLVIDATGRGSRLPQWLDLAGLHCPPMSVVDGRITYASRLYALDADPHRDWLASYEPTLAPAAPRGGVVARVGPCHWLLGLIGAAGHTPPADEAGFRAYAAGLRNPDLAGIIDEGTPLTPIHRTRATANRLHRYHRVDHWPGHVIALGDSVCALNPVYGQGMTVAALQAALLSTLLDRYAETGRPAHLGPAFQQGAARLVRGPWLLSTSADRAWAAERAPLASRLATGYLTALTARLPQHTDLFLRFARTMHMLDTPRALVSPRVVAQLSRPAHFGRAREATVDAA
ncbi:FAD-dependent oxidoreductase [Streptomyces albicerus]|uniref:FAD-dependent oxidoreductase n=1 Tax=Streptomyces albicerus TaxID=2569859 RepID=UPI001CECFD0D|nr:monooxygenase [Streptomyces albicerus]